MNNDETVQIKVPKTHENGRTYNSLSVLEEKDDHFVVQLYNPVPEQEAEVEDEGGDEDE